MDTFGERLKNEREDRGLTNEAVAEILKVDIGLLEALERNDYDALPDEAAMMECLHAYADCLDVDADLMIEDYSGEREKHLKRREEARVQAVAETTAAPVPGSAKARSRISPWLVVLIVAIALFAAWWMLSRDGSAPTPETSLATAPAESQPLPSEPSNDVTPAPVEAEPVSTEGPAESQTPAAATPSPDPPAAAPAPEPAPARSSLTIAEYGVGTAVENRLLVGEGNRFSEGTRVWFWTRVQGGASGDTIDHVWLRDGMEATNLTLKIGGPSWRTYTAQTLFAGAAGSWAVEARDAEGRVLARSEFVCVP